MRETEPKDETASKVEPRTPCYFCGNDDSGKWHWSATLGRLVCDDCYQRSLCTPPPTIPAVKPPEPTGP